MAASLVFRLQDRGPELVREVLLERGWEEYDEEREDEGWNLYWRCSAFRSSEYHNLLPWQRLNHHPKTAGITRKDCLARNLRRMRATVGSSLYDFSPTAFILPNDYTRFLAEYERRRPAGCWICKPVDLSRGRGIFIFQDIKDLVYDGPVIVQRYVSRPLLVSGYKFDLRLYVCVKSFHPLTVYVHQEGLVRFATEKYDLSSLHNLYAHLTNTSINKLGPFYRTEKGRVGPGCKWTMSKFRHFLHGQDVDEPLLWQRISNIVTLTLLTIAPSVPSCPNCVELFGFDVLIDSEFKPWLLEVNYSPALTLDCQADVKVKRGLVGDLIDLMNYTSQDGLRERAYQRHGLRRPCFHAARASHPVTSGCKETKVQKKTRGVQTLPPLKTLRPSKQTNRGEQGVVSGQQGRLPPVYAARAGTVKTEPTLNATLGPHSAVNRQARPALAPWLTDNRRLHVSEVTNRDDTETGAGTGPEGGTDVSSQRPDSPRGGPGLGGPAGSWKLPSIYSGRPGTVRATRVEHVPPLRVGDFIRTFPFNAATLKASQHKLDVKSVVQELHKLTARLTASDRSDRTTWGRAAEEGEGDFDSLLWGPKDPPLLSQCLRPA